MSADLAEALLRAEQKHATAEESLLAEEVRRLSARVAKMELKHEDDMSTVIAERDRAEDVINELCGAIGWNPEWTSAYTFNDAIVEAGERVAAMQAEAHRESAHRHLVDLQLAQAERRNARLVAAGRPLRGAFAGHITYLPSKEELAAWDAALADNGAKQSDVALSLIASERARQISVRGWTPEHDDTHTNHELAKMASVYAMPCSCRSPQMLTLLPGDVEVPDPRTEAERIRELVKAGALIAAEIERLQRAEAATNGGAS